MTLTTEQIEQVIDDCRKGAAMRGLFNKWIVEEMASELLRCRDHLAELSAVANREAQPVYQYRMRNPYNGQVTDWKTTKPEQVDFILKETIAANVEFRIIAAPPAQAVPEEMKRDPDADVFDPGFMNGWNACRAAMLAQPVSQGYKLVPVEPTAEMINAALASGALSIRTAYRAMLAAAPEGGNEN
ncbi:hypothetical protein [Serratia marcescens]|uniref:hypothetical protein n=1 Tax=Serratia marcescens TaxID=615 RepID=UPI00202A90B7|nr:hypothetical protein [Serratia marcescens]